MSNLTERNGVNSVQESGKDLVLIGGKSNLIVLPLRWSVCLAKNTFSNVVEGFYNFSSHDANGCLQIPL